MTRANVLELVPAFEPDPTQQFEIHPLGTLEITDGQVCCCDPLVGDGEPFERSVPNGRHPVEVVVARSDGDERVAFAHLAIGDGRPVTWVLATRAGDRIETLREGQRFGFGVDSGTACFSVAEPSECDVDVIEAQMRRHQRTTWSHAEWPTPQGAALIAFSSGYGDGVYSAWWGLDPQGNVASLVVDFGLLSIGWPEPKGDPDARASFARELMARLRADPSFDGYAIAMDLGALGREARDFAAELLGFFFDPARDAQRTGILRALALIAREAPEVADLVVERWRDSRPPADELLSVLERVPNLSESATAAIESVVRDTERDVSFRSDMLREWQKHASRGDVVMLLDRLTKDPAPEMRAQALSSLRDYDEPALWASRVEQYIDDRSPLVRKELARELGAWSNDVDRWVEVLAPLMADISPEVQIAAATSLAYSDRYWKLAVPLFEAALEREPDSEEANHHFDVLWALAQSKVPHEVGRSLAAPLRRRYANHPAMSALYRDAGPRALEAGATRKSTRPAKRTAVAKKAVAKKSVVAKKKPLAKKKPVTKKSPGKKK